MSVESLLLPTTIQVSNALEFVFHPTAPTQKHPPHHADMMQNDAHNHHQDIGVTPRGDEFGRSWGAIWRCIATSFGVSSTAMMYRNQNEGNDDQQPDRKMAEKHSVFRWA